MGESDSHRLLKEVGWAILIRKGCSPAGTEVSLPTWEQPNAFELPPNGYRIVDAAGIASIQYRRKKSENYYGARDYIRGILAIETKVSRSDFKAGYCTRGWNKLWFITPPGLLKRDEIPGGVGLYEYDEKTSTLELIAKAAMNTDFRPSDSAVQNIRESVVWSGYGNDVHHRLSGPRFQKIMGGQQTILDMPPKEDEE